MIERTFFSPKKLPKFIERDVITYEWWDDNGDYCVMHYWKKKFTEKGWKNLKKYSRYIAKMFWTL
jgi:hypothetical protein